MNQTVEMIPDIIGMGWAAEVQAQLEVRQLGGISEVSAGDEHLFICHNCLVVTDSFLAFKR